MAYDATANTWTTKASLPRPLWGMNQAAVLQGKIYVSGGCHLSTAPKWTEQWTVCVRPGDGHLEREGRDAGYTATRTASALLGDVRPDRRHRGPAIHSE